jgi:hypothetical protein
MLKRLAVFALLASFCLFAAEPVATLTAGTDVKVNGRLLQTDGVPNWPLAAGDEIITGSSPAVVLFPDGVRLTISPSTKIVIQQCDRCIVQLFYGSTDYVKPANSKFEMCALGHPVRPVENTQGTVLVEGKDKVIVRVAGVDRVVTSGTCACNTGAIWAHSHVKTIVLVTAGGAAVTGTTVGLVRRKKASAQ